MNWPLLGLTLAGGIERVLHEGNARFELPPRRWAGDPWFFVLPAGGRFAEPGDASARYSPALIVSYSGPGLRVTASVPIAALAEVA